MAVIFTWVDVSVHPCIRWCTHVSVWGRWKAGSDVGVGADVIPFLADTTTSTTGRWPLVLAYTLTPPVAARHRKWRNTWPRASSGGAGASQQRGLWQGRQLRGPDIECCPFEGGTDRVKSFLSQRFFPLHHLDHNFSSIVLGCKEHGGWRGTCVFVFIFQVKTKIAALRIIQLWQVWQKRGGVEENVCETKWTVRKAWNKIRKQNASLWSL